MDIRKGDTVIITAGKDKGKQGTVEKVFRDQHKVVVAGANIMKRHVKPNNKYPSGGIIEIAYPLDWSNIAPVAGQTEAKSTKKTKK